MIFKKKSNNFNYSKFLQEISISAKRNHILKDSEVFDYFLKNIDKKKYSISLSIQSQEGFISSYNWELCIIDKKSRDVIVNSKYMEEYLLYKYLYDIMKGDKNEKI